jgi:hypothetical protein
MESVTAFSKFKSSVLSSCKIVLDGGERIVEKDHLSPPPIDVGVLYQPYFVNKRENL